MEHIQTSNDATITASQESNFGIVQMTRGRELICFWVNTGNNWPEVHSVWRRLIDFQSDDKDKLLIYWQELAEIVIKLNELV